MQVTDYHVYDIKYVSARDFNYNPALGTGQSYWRCKGGVKKNS